MTAASGPWLVLYDGECGFCKWLLAWLLRWDRHRRLAPIALQASRAAELLADIEPDERLASFHLIDPAGERRSAGAALPALLRLLPGGRFVAMPFALAPRPTERAYRWVAENRTALSRFIPARSKRRGGDFVRRREAEA